jgi:hypothetical protein
MAASGWGWTRAQLCAGLGLPARTLDTLERQAICVPTLARAAGDTRPARYDPTDTAIVAAAWSAYRLGVRGVELRRFADALRSRSTRLVPGWSGLVAWDGDAVDLVPGSWSAPVGSPTTAVLVVPVTVPMELA